MLLKESSKIISKEDALKIVKLEPFDLIGLPKTVIDEDIAYYALIGSVYNTEPLFEVIPNDILKNKNFAIKVMKKSPLLCIEFKYLHNDPDVIIASMKAGNIAAIDLVSDELKDNKEFIMQVIGIHPDSLVNASKRLKNDIDVVLLAIELNTRSALTNMEDDCHQNMDVLFAAFKKNALALASNLKFFPDIRNQFITYLKKVSEKDFIQSLRNINLQIDSKTTPFATHHKIMIDVVLSGISSFQLKKIDILNPYLKTIVVQSLKDKSITEIVSLEKFKVNKKSRKIL